MFAVVALFFSFLISKNLHVIRKNQDCTDNPSCSESETDEDGDLFVNTNHLHSLVVHSETDSSDEESSEESNEEDADNNNTNKIE